MAGGPNVGYATLSLIPSAKGMLGGLTKEMGPIGDAAGKSFGDRFTRVMGGVGKTAAAAIGVGIAAGAGLLKLGGMFDDAFDKILIGTGATGSALDGLKTDFNKVFTTVPVSADQAATAIADLNTRLGLTGKPLQDLSAQFLDLSRITGTDVAGNIKGVTRVFGDWGIQTGDQSKALDQLFKASQVTGASIDQLSSGIVQFGAPLRQLGFSFEQGTALIGKFEREGVNTETVMGGLRIALGKMARAGEAPIDTFRRTVASIKAAGSAGEANTLALELFGARAGPDMAAAIREGRFEIDELVAQLQGAEGAITGTAAATDDWKEKLALLRNKALAKLGPLAAKVFDAVTRGIEWASPYLARFADWLGPRLTAAGEAVTSWFRRNWPTIQAAIATVAGVVARVWQNQLRPALEGIGRGLRAAFEWVIDHKEVLIGIAAGIGAALVALFAVWAAGALSAAAATLAAAAPFIAIGAAIGALVAGVIYAYTHWDWFRTTVDAVAKFLTGTLWPVLKTVFGWLRDNVPKIISAVIDTATWLWRNVLSPLASFLGAAFKIAFEAAKLQFDAIRTAIGFVIDAAGWLWNNVLSPLVSFVKGAFSTGMGVAVAVFDAIRSSVDLVIGVVKTMIDWFRKGVDWAKDLLDVMGLLEVKGKVTGTFTKVGGNVKVGAFASGTMSAPGGLAWVGERGPELVNLPRGAQVFPADQSARMAGGASVVNNIVVHDRSTGADIVRESTWAWRIS